MEKLEFLLHKLWIPDKYSDFVRKGLSYEDLANMNKEEFKEMAEYMSLEDYEARRL